MVKSPWLVLLAVLVAFFAHDLVNAQEWQYTGPVDEPICDVCFSPSNYHRIFAVCESGLYRTEDFGENWQQLLEVPVHKIVVSHADSTLVYAMNDGLVARSDDRGDTWTVLLDGDNHTIFTIQPHTSNPDIVYLRCLSGVWRSLDRGDTWTEIWQDNNHYATDCLVIDPFNPDSVFTISTEQIWHGGENGDTWVAADGPTEDFVYPLSRYMRTFGASLTEYVMSDSTVLRRNPWDSDWGEPYWYNDAELEFPFVDILPCREGSCILVGTQGLAWLSDWVFDPPASPPHLFQPPEDISIRCADTFGDWHVVMALGTESDGVLLHDHVFYSGVDEQQPNAVPKAFAIAGLYPNPFNSSTRVTLQLASPGTVRLSVFNVLGQEVAVVHNGLLHAGQHAFNWNASTVASGVYMVRATSESNARDTRMITLIR